MCCFAICSLATSSSVTITMAADLPTRPPPVARIDSVAYAARYNDAQETLLQYASGWHNPSPSPETRRQSQSHEFSQSQDDAEMALPYFDLSSSGSAPSTQSRTSRAGRAISAPLRNLHTTYRNTRDGRRIRRNDRYHYPEFKYDNCRFSKSIC